MFYLLSNSSLEEVDFRMSKGYIIQFLLNLGSNFSIPSMDNLRERVEEYLRLNNLDCPIGAVPYHVIYDMYVGNYLIDVITPIRMKSKPAASIAYVDEEFAVYDELKNMERRNPHKNFHNLFLKFSERKKKVYRKKDRVIYLKRYIYKKENQQILPTEETRNIAGKILLDVELDNFFYSEKGFSEISYRRFSILRAYRDYKDIDFYKIAVSELNLVDSNKLADLDVKFIGYRNVPNFFNGFTNKEVLDYFILQKDDNKEYSAYEYRFVEIFKKMLEKNNLSLDEQSASAMKLYLLIDEKKIGEQDWIIKSNIKDRLKKYIFNQNKVSDIDDFEDFSISVNGFVIKLTS